MIWNCEPERTPRPYVIRCVFGKLSLDARDPLQVSPISNGEYMAGNKLHIER